MSKDWVRDIETMHGKYQTHHAMVKMDADKLKKFLEFRINFLQEEMDELKNAEGAEDVVDALIDLCVVAIGTLDCFEVDSHVAWDRVLEANMNKEVGVKSTRPNPLGLPDLVKPDGWVAPSHEGNHGRLTEVF